jgi:hypothetical protein
MKFNLPLSIVFFALLGIVISPSCKKKEMNRATEIPEAVKSYVYAYTAGVISKNSPVRVQFAGAAVTADMVGKEAGGIIDFTPGISGSAVWETDHTLRFDPKESWESGTGYLAKVSLNKVFDNLPKEAGSFEFNFLVREQGLALEVFGISAPDPNDLSKQDLTGSLRTNDVAENEALEKVLTVSQGGKTLSLEWTHDSDGLGHRFTASGVARGNKASIVKVSWNGKAVGVDAKDEREVEVPALGDFTITSARVVEEGSQYVVLNFSDPLLASQDLSGLIAFKNPSAPSGYNFDYDTYQQNLLLNFTIDGNNVLVYPSRRLTGSQQLEIRPGIRNVNNSPMERPGLWQVEFEQVKPRVRLVGRGVVLPSSDQGLVLPFEAISLEAVEVEIFKIYDNNILQFLQTSDIDGNDNYELHRVGKVIRREMVPLKGLNPNANTSAWTRYALDLGKLFKADPNAIYQVRIGFRPEYTTFQCPGKERKEGTLKTLDQQNNLDENGDIRSFWDQDYFYYGIEGYYDSFNWEHFKNPCYPAYYSAQNFVQSNVFASDLGITAKSGKDGSMFVAVADLRTTKPVKEAEIEFYDFQKQLISTAKTNGDGIAEVELPKNPFVIIAKKEKQKGYLKTTDGSSLSLSRYDVAGTVAQKGLKGYLYGERGVWRPGDSLFLNFILEDKSERLPANYPIAFELQDSRGQVQYKTVSTKNVENVYPLHFATSPDAPTGNWIAIVKAGGATFDKVIKIEMVKPNRLKINMDFGSKEELSFRDEPVAVNMQVDWLHGAAGQSLRTVVEAEMKQVNTEFKNYKDYEFDDPARTLFSTPNVIFDGSTDKNGKATLRAPLYNARTAAPGKLQVNFRARAFEKGGDFSIRSLSMPYSPYPAYVGILTPKDDSGSKQMDVGKNANLKFVLLDEKGNPMKYRNLTVGLYRVEWRWWWDRGEDYVSQFNSSNHFNAIETADLKTGQDGSINWSVNIKQWGRYLIRVCDAQDGHCSGDFVYAGYPWYDDEGGSLATRKEAAMMTFTATKEKYKVGEDIEIKVPAGEAGRVLITLETGSKVISSMWKEAKKGQNSFKFEAKENMSPTVYAHVSLIQPHGQTKNDLPIRMYGVLPIDVENPETVLKPSIKMADELKPEQEFTVEVREEHNEPMAYTIAVVDEGLLGLTNFKTPDPHGAMYAREALGVKTWDLYDYVLGAYGGELERILSIGGDGEIEPPAERKNANRFKPVVLHAGPFLLDGGKKVHKLKMPNYVGSVRVMLVAANADAAYGSTEKIVPVKKPLMALATLPRVLGPGETLRMPVSIFAMDNKVKNVDVQLAETTGLVKISGGATKQLSFAKPGEDLVFFDLTVGDRVGVAKFKVNASGGGEKASQDIEIAIRNPNPYITNVYAGILQPGQSWSQDVQAVGVPGTNEGILELSSIPPLKLGERLRFLLEYPYGCVEQTVSAVFPQLYVSKLTPLNDLQQKEVKNNIEAGIDKLHNFQLASGAFAYWPGSDYSPWGTSYAGHFLLEAKNAGYTVPDNLIDRWVKFQQLEAKNWNPGNRGSREVSQTELDQAYRLYTLALARKPEQGAMNVLRESKNLSLTARWRLAAAYALTGKTDIGKKLVQNATVQVDPYEELSYTFGSSLRDEGMILEALVNLGDSKTAAELARRIAEKLSEGFWYSTQTTSFALLGVGKFVGKWAVEDQINFSYSLGNGKFVDAGSTTPLMQIDVPVDKGNARLVSVKNTGNNILYARLLLSGQPLVGDATAAANHLQIDVSYTTPAGQRLDPTNLPQGTDFIAQVIVTNPGSKGLDYEEMALSQIFPSGWEIINTRLFNLNEFSNATVPEYQDVRDDRVYTHFDIKRNTRHLYQVRLTAAYQGRYYLPTVTCEAMYDHSINARKPGQWVNVGGERSL